MRSRSAVVCGVVLLALSLTGCAAGANGAASVPTSTPEDSSAPAASDSADAAALAQAEEWLASANLPSAAVRSQTSIGGFSSYTGWPCGPVEELEAFWTIADATVAETANWLMENPTADLISTGIGPVPEDPTISSATVGYIPTPESQEGIVYTVLKSDDGVVVRAEIAAQTSAATCAPLPDGAVYGAPGQG